MIKALAQVIALGVLSFALCVFCHRNGIPYWAYICLLTGISAVWWHADVHAERRKHAAAAQALAAAETKTAVADQALNEALLGVARRELEEFHSPKPPVAGAAPERLQPNLKPLTGTKSPALSRKENGHA